MLIAFLRDWRVTAIAAISLPLTHRRHLLHPAPGGRHDQPDVARRPRHRHRPRHRRRDRRRREHPPAPGARARRWRWRPRRARRSCWRRSIGSTLTTVVVFVPLGPAAGRGRAVLRRAVADAGRGRAAVARLRAAVHPERGRHAFLRDHGPSARAARRPAVAVATSRLLRAALRAPARSSSASRWPCAGARRRCFYLRLETGFLPEMDEGGYVIDYWTPDGHVAARDRPDGAAASRRCCSARRRWPASRGAPAPSSGCSPPSRTPATSSCGSSRGRERSRTAEEVIEEQRATFAKEMPGMTIEFVQLLQDMLGDLEGNPEPIEVKIFGDDLADAGARWPTRTAERLKKIPGARGPRRAAARQPRAGRAHRPDARGEGRLHRRSRCRASSPTGLLGKVATVVPARRPADRRARAVPRPRTASTSTGSASSR